jgi:hypothetical protein
VQVGSELVWRVMWSPLRSMSRSNVWNSMSAAPSSLRSSAICRCLLNSTKGSLHSVRFQWVSDTLRGPLSCFHWLWSQETDGRSRQHHPSRGARPNVRIYLSYFPFSRAYTSSASGCCLLICMIRGQQRPAGQLPRSPLQFKHLFFARHRPSPPTLSSLSSNVDRPEFHDLWLSDHQPYHPLGNLRGLNYFFPSPSVKPAVVKSRLVTKPQATTRLIRHRLTFLSCVRQ